MNVLSFQDALIDSEKPNAAYDTNKWLYVPNTYLPYRYILATKGKKTLLCIGINPSTAEPDNLDNTLKSVDRISKFNGFDSFCMFNVYPERATNPNDLSKCINSKMHNENMNAFEYILRTYKIDHIWLAFGNIIDKRSYLFDCLYSMMEIADKYKAKFYSCGKISKLGNPHHPLYLRSDSPLDEFNIKEYLDKKRKNPTL